MPQVHEDKAVNVREFVWGIMPHTVGNKIMRTEFSNIILSWELDSKGTIMQIKVLENTNANPT